MANASALRIAPGPRGHPLIGNLITFRRDVLGLLLESRRRFGDVVRFRLGPHVIHLVAHPEHIKHVLLTNQHNYNKDTRSSAKIRDVTGEGLLTSSGDAWLRQRRLSQPVFQAQRLTAFVGIMTDATAVMLRRWRADYKPGKPLDIASEMMRLTCSIVTRALLGADLSADLGAIEDAATLVMAHTYRRLETLVDLPPRWPNSRNRRFRRALRSLDGIVYRILQEREQRPADGGNLLSLLLHQRDEENGQGMTAEQLRNELITLLLAGHETTANALTWTWYLLSRHPGVARQVRAEVIEVLGERAPTAEDLPKLAGTLRVIQESLRLYPPIWIMERRGLADDVIAGCRIPAGSTVVISPYVTHRHPDFWDNPEGFDPDRFRPERFTEGQRPAYLPFGMGQRLCIGNNFALLEARVIVAMVLQAFWLDLVPGFPVVPKPGITLRSRDGLLMTLRPQGGRAL
jgi:cytochrome P450